MKGVPPSFLENSFQCRSSKTARHAIFPQNGSEKTRNEDMPFFRKMDQKRIKIKKKTPCLFGRGKKLKVFWVYLPLYQKFYRLIVFLKITRRETTTLSTTLYPMQERRPAENGWNQGLSTLWTPYMCTKFPSCLILPGNDQAWWTHPVPLWGISQEGTTLAECKLSY